MRQETTILEQARKDSMRSDVVFYTPKGANSSFRFDLPVLKTHYQRYIALTDAEFIKALPHALHFACFICYVKKISLEDSVSDTGIIHRIAHLIHSYDGGLRLLKSESDTIAATRKQFKELLEPC